MTETTNFFRALVLISFFSITMWYMGLIYSNTIVISNCPCVNVSLCQPIRSGPRNEVFGFSISSANWPKYDWNKLTTIALFYKRYDYKLICYAHSKGVRVVLQGAFPISDLTNGQKRTQYVKNSIAKAKKYYLDGINMDIEAPISKNSPESKGLTALMEEMSKIFHSQIPGSQVSIDVAWSPNCIDKRCYNYRGLAKASDFMVVMAYDERSQIYGRCIADANSPFNQTFMGLQQYLNLGIPKDKLVLGQPWYGYDYMCLKLTDDDICYIKKKGFRGVPCSDAAGVQHDYALMQSLLHQNATTRLLWNSTAQSPFFMYKSTKDGRIHQIWYDDPRSLGLKYKTAMQTFKIRGLAFWTIDSLNYGNSSLAKNETKEMWDTIGIY